MEAEEARALEAVNRRQAVKILHTEKTVDDFWTCDLAIAL
jgi:hypothetical protein